MMRGKKGKWEGGEAHTHPDEDEENARFIKQ